MLARHYTETPKCCLPAFPSDQDVRTSSSESLTELAFLYFRCTRIESFASEFLLELSQDVCGLTSFKLKILHCIAHCVRQDVVIDAEGQTKYYDHEWPRTSVIQEWSCKLRSLHQKQAAKYLQTNDVFSGIPFCCFPYLLPRPHATPCNSWSMCISSHPFLKNRHLHLCQNLCADHECMSHCSVQLNNLDRWLPNMNLLCMGSLSMSHAFEGLSLSGLWCIWCEIGRYSWQSSIFPAIMIWSLLLLLHFQECASSLLLSVLTFHLPCFPAMMSAIITIIFALNILWTCIFDCCKKTSSVRKRPSILRCLDQVQDLNVSSVCSIFLV